MSYYTGVQSRRPINTMETPTSGEDTEIYDESFTSKEDPDGSLNLTRGNTSSDNSTQHLYNNKDELRRRSTISQNRSTDRINLKKVELESYIETPTQSTNWLLPLFSAAVGLCFVGFALQSMLTMGNRECKYNNLRELYPQQDEKMWHDISITIENILNKRSKSPAVNLFVHQGGKEVQDFVRQIAQETSKCFDEKLTLVEMKESDFTSSGAIKEYGNVIEIFKSKIKRGRVAVILNLNIIPAESARALHTICDTHNPIAQEIAIFLTLTTPTADGNPVANAENTLRDLWGAKLQHSELDPLITRVTDQVFALKSLK